MGAPLKTLGLLGGMSWESTLLYYRGVNERVRARHPTTLRSAPLLLHSFDFAQVEALQAAGDWTALGALLGDAAAGLAAAGAAAIVICTNTMHRVAPAVEARSRLPVLHIADMTGRAARAARLVRLGLLGTRYTMEMDFYRARLEERWGVQVVVPGPAAREVVHRVIYSELCVGVVRDESREEYVRVARELVDAHSAQGIVLGCTEITMLLRAEDVPDVPLLDTTAIHAQGAADWAMEAA